MPLRPAADSDQRGIDRSQSAHCDIGAFESQGFTLALTSGSGQSVAPGAAFSSPLVATVASTHGEPVQNGIVTFSGPASGAGIQSSPVSGTIAANGQASITPTANGTTGSYSDYRGERPARRPLPSPSRLTNGGATPQTYSVTTTGDGPDNDERRLSRGRGRGLHAAPGD